MVDTLLGVDRLVEPSLTDNGRIKLQTTRAEQTDYNCSDATWLNADSRGCHRALQSARFGRCSCATKATIVRSCTDGRNIVSNHIKSYQIISNHIKSSQEHCLSYVSVVDIASN